MKLFRAPYDGVGFSEIKGLRSVIITIFAVFTFKC